MNYNYRIDEYTIVHTTKKARLVMAVVDGEERTAWIPFSHSTEADGVLYINGWLYDRAPAIRNLGGRINTGLYSDWTVGKSFSPDRDEVSHHDPAGGFGE